MNKKLIITGTGLDGMIGSRVQELLKNDFVFIPISQKEMDITKKDQVEKKINSFDFDIFIHLAALTNVDLCEKEKDLAYKINVEGTKNVFETLQKLNKKMIHISTDFIFDGKNSPYYEDSTPNPISIYGSTKYEAEKIVKDRVMIIRPSFPFRANFELKSDIVRTFIDLLKSEKKITGVSDSTITLTFIDDIAFALKYLFQNFDYKTYHIVGANSFTPYNAILKICEIFNLDKNLVSKTSYEDFYKGKAQRPQFSEIKTKNNNFYKMKTFEEGLAEIKKQIENY